MIRSHETIVVGAGPAGLATSRELTRAGVDHCVLERGDQLGHTWANLYDSLVLHTGRHLSALPGLAFPSGTPLFPARRDFLDYLHRYASTFSLPIETSSDVTGNRAPGRPMDCPAALRCRSRRPDARRRHRHRGQPPRAGDLRARSIHRTRHAQHRLPAAGRDEGQACSGRRSGQLRGRNLGRARAGGRERDAGGPDRRDHRASGDARRSDSVLVGRPLSLAKNARAAPHDRGRAASRTASDAVRSRYVVPEGTPHRPRAGDRLSAPGRFDCKVG